MKYKVIKEVELDSKTNQFVDTSAQCMLQLLSNRLCKGETPDYEDNEDFDINFDFSMYGDELMRMKEEMGFSNDKFINSAESFMRKL